MLASDSLAERNNRVPPGTEPELLGILFGCLTSIGLAETANLNSLSFGTFRYLHRENAQWLLKLESESSVLALSDRVLTCLPFGR